MAAIGTEGTPEENAELVAILRRSNLAVGTAEEAHSLLDEIRSEYLKQYQAALANEQQMQHVNYDELDSPDGVTYSWQGQPFTGTSYELRPEGQLWNEMDFVNGQYHGQMRSWFPSGQLEEETTYYNGVTYGPDWEWDEAGQLRREALIEYSFLVREKKWDEAGRLVEEYEMPPNHPNYSLLEKFRARYGADPRFSPVGEEAVEAKIP